MKDLCNTYDLRSHTSEPICSKNPENSTNMDPLSTNHALVLEILVYLRMPCRTFTK